MIAKAPVCVSGCKPPAFTLPATDGRIYSLDDIRGRKGTLIVLISDHFPT